MLSGISNLLFGSSESGTGDAAGDQTQASQHAAELDTKDTDSGWVLVDVADNAPQHSTGELLMEQSSASHQEVPDLQPQAEMAEDVEQEENEPRDPAAHDEVLPQAPRQAAQGLNAGELEQRKVARVIQRQQQTAARKQLNKKHLEAANKARMVQGSGRKSSASARNRVLQPSGHINSRRSQRHQ